MGESIVIPILLGVGISIILFLITLYIFKQEATKSAHVAFCASIIVLIISLIIGSWLGMGIGVIAFGMLLGSILIYFINFTFSKIRLEK